MLPTLFFDFDAELFLLFLLLFDNRKVIFLLLLFLLDAWLLAICLFVIFSINGGVVLVLSTSAFALGLSVGQLVIF